MNRQQLDQIKSKIEAFKNIDLSLLVVQQYPNQDIRNVNISEIDAASFISISKRTIKQLENELEGNGFLFLPFQYNFHNEFGNGNLLNDLDQFFAQLSSRNFPQSVQFLNRLVYYQVDNGFWNKSKAKLHNLRGMQVTALEEKLTVLTEQIEMSVNSCNDLKNNLKTQIEDLSNFQSQKEKELSQISNNLEVSNNEKNQISELHNISISTNEKIIALLNNALEKVNNFKKEAKENENKQQELQKTIASLISAVENRIEVFEEKGEQFGKHLKDIEDKKAFFDERNKYLTDLIGREVGASLFETFKQRKKELKPSVDFWKKAVPIMTIITIFGIYAIFSNFFGYLSVDGDTTKNGWGLFALRSLKSLPLFILLYFTIHQYGKERHFKEEYAFKSAVALTIKAYSDLIGNQDKKDEMIFNSVTGIYKSPINTKSKEQPIPIKDVTELLKKVTDTTSEVVKKVS